MTSTIIIGNFGNGTIFSVYNYNNYDRQSILANLHRKNINKFTETKTLKLSRLTEDSKSKKMYNHKKNTF